MKNLLRLTAKLLVCCLASLLAGQTYTETQILTEAEAVSIGLNRAELRAVLEGRAEVAESKLMAQKYWDNPEVSISREDIDQAGIAASETYLLVSQRFSLFGVRKMRTQAAQHRKRAVLYGNDSQKLAIKAEIQALFYEVLHHQQRMEIMENWQSKAEAIEDLIVLREQAGQVSGYDRRRLISEMAVTKAQLDQEIAAYVRAWEKLRFFLRDEGNYIPQGVLLPDKPIEPLEPQSVPLPSLLAYDALIDAAKSQERAERQWKMPEITVEAGVKRVNIGGEKDQGTFLSARLPLPAWNRNRAGLMQARAQAKLARGEKELAEKHVHTQRQGLRFQIDQMYSALAQFRQDGLASSVELVAIASLAYPAGEMELLTLLDAYRTLREAELTVLSMAAEIRQLTIELERLGGVQ